MGNSRRNCSIPRRAISYNKSTNDRSTTIRNSVIISDDIKYSSKEFVTHILQSSYPALSSIILTFLERYAKSPLSNLTATGLIPCGFNLMINHQSLIATKTNRIVKEAGGRPVMEFGARRAHGTSAAIYGARAAIIPHYLILLLLVLFLVVLILHQTLLLHLGLHFLKYCKCQ